MGRGEEEEGRGREEGKGESGGFVGCSVGGGSVGGASAKGVGGRFDGGDESVADARDVGEKEEEEEEEGEAAGDAAGDAAGEETGEIRGAGEIKDKGKGKGKARCTEEEVRDIKGKGKGKARRTEEEELREKQAMIAQCMAEMQVASEELRRSDEELRMATEELRRADEEIARLDAEMEDEEAREEEEWRRIAERDTRKRVKLAGRCEHVRSFGESSRGAGTHEPAVRVAVSDTTGGSSSGSLFTFLNATDVDQDTPSLRGGNASSPDDDPAALLDELRSLVRTAHAPEARNDDAGPNTDDIRQMLAELDQAPSSAHTPPAADTDTDPRQMLAELARLSNPVSQRVSSPTDQDEEGDEEGDEEEDDDHPAPSQTPEPPLTLQRNTTRARLQHHHYPPRPKSTPLPHRPPPRIRKLRLGARPSLDVPPLQQQDHRAARIHPARSRPRTRSR
ncbi:hypothetical protein C7974DRAFT_78073 [Boeremia exigua]|uniref:uncharacterized protein n=1 Tax=Boeremia exigua TaxID=749465 RepID=UPI001E8D5556|nr:uncharacterized protein C7974DRAFT_78073 [Boeremia exigua]KAH6612456.1 hypothetical protein C7974DRAFT_78073 [Boeremia exigua]